MPDAPEIAGIRRLRLLPGDALALVLDEMPGEEVVARMMADLAEQFPGVPCVVLGPGADLAVVERAPTVVVEPGYRLVVGAHGARVEPMGHG